MQCEALQHSYLRFLLCASLDYSCERILLEKFLFFFIISSNHTYWITLYKTRENENNGEKKRIKVMSRMNAMKKNWTK